MFYAHLFLTFLFFFNLFNHFKICILNSFKFFFLNSQINHCLTRNVIHIINYPLSLNNVKRLVIW